MSSVAKYEVTLNPRDFKWFRRNIGTDRCVPAALGVGKDTRRGWIGYRGRYSRFFRKPSFDVWFGDREPLEGHSMLHLNASYRDPSLLRSRLAMQVFADLGVPAPRTWHVWLTMNKEPLGLYLALESVDAHWLRRQGAADGCIYYAVGSQGNFGLINPSTKRPKRFLAKGYEKRHPLDSNTSDLEELIRHVGLTSDREFAEQIDRVLDVETFLRWLVGVEFMSHTDGLVQNYALFRPASGRWRISPWDCDGTFGRVPNGEALYADEMPIGTGEDNYLAVRLLRSNRWRQRYREIWGEALRTVFARQHIVTLLAQFYQEIRPYALRDTNKRINNSTFGREPALIGQYIVERTAVVRQRLAQM